MEIQDEERFKQYLQQFRPIVPDPLKAGDRSRSLWHRIQLHALVGFAAMLAMVGAVLSHRPPGGTASPRLNVPVTVEERTPAQPLTMQSANALLATAPSIKTAMDHLAFRSNSVPLREGGQSALAVLRKEKIRL